MLASAVYDFLVSNLPSPLEVIVLGPPFLTLACLYLAAAGALKRRRRMHTGYTRKVFHFLVFGTAVIMQLVAGTRTLCLFGACTSAVIFYALWRGDGHPFYEAMARESDAPRRTYFIVVPYFATLVGGVLANVLFGDFAVVGYLVAGLGDAVGEPVGTRFGKHRYRVPFANAANATRSLEGSLAVGVTSAGASAAGAVLLGFAAVPALALRSVSIGVLAAGVEAVAPHGWDNLPLQIVPALLAWALL